MFNNRESSFSEMEEDLFSDYISSIEVDLRKNNKEYKKLMDEMSKILKKYPKLRKVYEDDEASELSKDECEAIIKLLNNQLELKYIGYKEMFFKGGAENYYYLKRMGLLKEENDTKQ